MTSEELLRELEKIVKEVFDLKGIDLIDLSLTRVGQRLLVRILADYPAGGINLDECARLNRELGDILDAKDLISQQYSLEVSSPGLDRRLKSNKDFLRCLNKEAVFFLNTSVNGKLEWQGVVINSDEEKVTIFTDGQTLEIPLSAINKAQLVLKK